MPETDKKSSAKTQKAPKATQISHAGGESLVVSNAKESKAAGANATPTGKRKAVPAAKTANAVKKAEAGVAGNAGTLLAPTDPGSATKTKVRVKPAAVADAATPAAPKVPGGQVRAVIDAVLPNVDAGRFAVKCIAGETFRVTAHCLADGHDALRVVLRWRSRDQATATEVPMKLRWNDEWRAELVPPSPGTYFYSVAAWVDSFESWRNELMRRVDAEDIRTAAQVGAIEIGSAAGRASGADRKTLTDWAASLERDAVDTGIEIHALKAMALDDGLAAIASRHPDRRLEAVSPVEYPLYADRARARFSTWYELFPRSTSPEPGRHGTFRDVEDRLPAIAKMGFDVLYFPPIHPIGKVNRKGRNNSLLTVEGDVGSPWAIGSEEGGHKSIHAELGTASDFRHLVAAAADHGMEIALDIAFQCAPDHPYVTAHPSWFRWRPDGTCQYAENPPKKYQDIYPFNFESEDWQGLWAELKSVFDHWIGEGVRIFRVDNPHTKAFGFWEWVITEIQRDHPDVLFLAEAFTRPKVMHRLAKLGYTQSYTYFTWRNTKQELTAYFTELAEGLGSDYFRPNVWPNTPDILHAQLQIDQPSIYMSRLVLAATLSSNYGIYGPSYELIDHRVRNPGTEEHLDSEKYQLRQWNNQAQHSLASFIASVNRTRKDNAALQRTDGVRFLDVDNDQLLAYVKTSADGENVVLTVVNLDPYQTQSGWIAFDPASVGIEPGQAVQMHDQLSNQRFSWQGGHHFVQLNPHAMPAHLFVLRKLVRSERDFDYFQ